MAAGPTPGSLGVTGPRVEVFWRPGCPYCAALRRGLGRRGVPCTWRNIWDDEQAAAFVRAATGGDETVPTVRVGDRTLINPSAAAVAALLGDGPQRAPRGAWVARWAISWLPTIALIVASVLLARNGHGTVSWVLDLLAVAGWWLTRPLRRRPGRPAG